ncbi:hypothetical protein PHAVU_005G028032 [Phaseolus vulgaris]
MRTEEVGVKIKLKDILRVEVAIIVRYYNHHLHAIQTSTLLKTSTPISCQNFLENNADFLRSVLFDPRCSYCFIPEMVDPASQKIINMILVALEFGGATIPASAEAIDSLKTFSISPFLKLETEKCSICLENVGFRENEENVKLSLLPCEHVFHHLCIVKWLQRSHTCPLCRYPMLVSHN